jgi:hypothetical protein
MKTIDTNKLMWNGRNVLLSLNFPCTQLLVWLILLGTHSGNKGILKVAFYEMYCCEEKYII